MNQPDAADLVPVAKFAELTTVRISGRAIKPLKFTTRRTTGEIKTALADALHTVGLKFHKSTGEVWGDLAYGFSFACYIDFDGSKFRIQDNDVRLNVSWKAGMPGLMWVLTFFPPVLGLELFGFGYVMAQFEVPKRMNEALQGFMQELL